MEDFSESYRYNNAQGETLTVSHELEMNLNVGNDQQ